MRHPRSADSGKLPLLFLGLKVQDQGAAMGIWLDLELWQEPADGH